MDIEQLIKKDLKQVDLKILYSGNVSGSGRGSYARSHITCYNCGENTYLKKDCISKVNGSGGNPPKMSPNKLPEQITKKPNVSDTKDLTASTMTRNNKKYN